VPGEEVVVDVTDLHESGAGIGHTEDGFVVMVDGILPEARARIEVSQVKPNYARGEVLERLPMEEDETDDEPDDDAAADADEADEEDEGPSLGSRDNFWGA
jgi:predicted RNA-binding protein with TRAM domain